MATARKRDYKAEYARAKARANAAGYQSLSEYKAARKTLRLKRTQKIIPKEQLRGKTPQQYRDDKDARLWSVKHSRQQRSKFSTSFDDTRREAYFDAFVKRRKGRDHAEVMADLKHYLTEYEDMDDDTFDQLYGND